MASCSLETCTVPALPSLPFCAAHLAKLQAMYKAGTLNQSVLADLLKSASLLKPAIVLSGGQSGGGKGVSIALASKPGVFAGSMIGAPPLLTPHGPKTQKAKGIAVLQSHGLLDKAYARIATTLAEAEAAAQSMGYPLFCRPCPITPRHGFVDSRVVKGPMDLAQVWHEAKAADKDAELILMPFIAATHSIVWRPGLLSVGPGHDGATAGHDSISVFLQADYSPLWQGYAQEAGVLATADPFIEAVATPSTETVLTQIRGGVKGAPTQPDWVPEACIVHTVEVIDPAHKADAGAMLAWEERAIEIGKVNAERRAVGQTGRAVVYNPGGNLGDHWSVHAQLANIPVLTTFKPIVGQQLPMMGQQLPELDAQAVVFGFLGGIVAPSLLSPLARKRAVCCAIMGTHHGLRMGGDSGVHIGASVAMMLRLCQAALWGEARHAEKTPKGAKLSRSQIYDKILDNWLEGRAGLRDKVKLFWTHKWGSGYGGMAWAACAQGTVALDSAILTLIKLPSPDSVKAVLAALTNVVNLAHNNGWWLNKFIGAEWFDLAAALDPRVAVMAGPIWYDAATADVGQRMQLFGKLAQMAPIDLSSIPGATVAAKAKTVTAKSHVGAHVGGMSEMGGSVAGVNSLGYIKKGSFGPTVMRGTVVLDAKPLTAAMEMLPVEGGNVHLQIAYAHGGQQCYVSGEVTGVSIHPNTLCAYTPSYSGSGKSYVGLAVADNGDIYCGSTLLLHTTSLAK